LIFGDANLAELARVDVAKEVIGPDLARLAFEKRLDDFEGGHVRHDHIVGLVLLERKPIYVVLEG